MKNTFRGSEREGARVRSSIQVNSHQRGWGGGCATKGSGQYGGEEGRALIPTGESTSITTNCWTVIDRKTLELTKKDTPHAKTKEEPQWDGRRGAITIKSNPITAGWVTHKLENTHTTEVHPREWRFWAPRQASQPGGLATGGGIPRESDFEG